MTTLLKTNMGRGIMLITVIAVLVIGYVGYTGSHQKQVLGKPKHIIVIDICSLRADHMSTYGYERKTTPHIDSFADEATTFDNFWTQSGWCLPNMATMLTGTRPEVHKMTYINTKLASSVTTLAQILGDNGYTTGGFSGSRYLVPNTYGLEKGFDTFTDPYTSKDVAMGSASYHENRPAVEKWIGDNKDNSFFLYVTIDDLHSPYSHSDDPNLFDPEYDGILNKVSADLLFDRIYNGESTVNDDPKTVAAVQEFKKDPKNLANLIARYDAGVLQVDEMVGGLLQTLKDKGVWDDSLIIITSHQGEQLGEHGQLGHINGIYEPILRVPLLVRYPGVADDGATISALTERIDIPSTVLDAAGLLGANGSQFSGTSLLPVLTDKGFKGKEYIFASSKPTWVPTTGEPSIEEYAVRNDQYKLLWYKYKNPQYELYDLKNDPLETKNLTASLPEIFSTLKTELNSYIQKTNK